jgi:hypothetical protein
MGIIWLIIGITYPKLRAFIGVGGAFIALGAKRKSADSAPTKTDTSPAGAPEATAE